MNNLGQKLKEKREDMQLSRKELGERIGVSQYIIAQYEEDNCDFSASILTKIMDELEIDFWETCSDTGIILTTQEPSEFSKMLAKEAEKCAREIKTNLKLEEAERKYGKNKNKKISKSYKDNVIKLDFGSKDR